MMKANRPKLQALLLATSIATIPGVAAAVPVVAGGPKVIPLGEDVVSDPSLAYNPVVSQSYTLHCYSGGSTIVTVSVTQETLTGTLDFYYDVNNDDPEGHGFDEVRVTDYSVCGGVDADYRSDLGGTLAPTQVARSMMGDEIKWFFTGASIISGGQKTHSLIVRTKQNAFNMNGLVTLVSTVDNVICPIPNMTFSPS
jgi:hypothetical protein